MAISMGTVVGKYMKQPEVRCQYSNSQTAEQLSAQKTRGVDNCVQEGGTLLEELAFFGLLIE